MLRRSPCGFVFLRSSLTLRVSVHTNPKRQRAPLACAVVLLVTVARAIAGEAVHLEKSSDAVVVTIDGREFTTYHTAKSQPKPYFWPVRAADGAHIARELDKPKDHPHHKGAWCSIDEVNGVKFWDEKGKIENTSVEIVAASGNAARFRAVNHWLGTDGRPILRETIAVSVYPSRLLVYDAEFSALDQPVTFGDTKEGMFGIRVADSLRGQAGGSIVNAEGLQGDSACWGKTSNWVDYFGNVDGKTYGVALFDDPTNFRKSRYHVRNYGLFTLSPFGQSAYTNGQLPAAPLTLEPGKSFRLRWGLYVHDGDTARGGVADEFERFARGEGK